MSQAILEKDVVSSTKENIENYFNTHDVKYVAEDAVFINMNSGEETHGREAIGQMIHFMYHVAFDAKAKITNTIITADKAVLEATFVGKHIGEIAGIAATNKQVSVPLCVTYDLENGFIKTGRIYMLESVMMKQLS
jgi:predicted ester cyclase